MDGTDHRANRGLLPGLSVRHISGVGGVADGSRVGLVPLAEIDVFGRGVVLHKLPVARYLGANVALWGLVTAGTAATTNFVNILSARMLLGILEACVVPAQALITAAWYTKPEQAPRFGLW